MKINVQKRHHTDNNELLWLYLIVLFIALLSLALTNDTVKNDIFNQSDIMRLESDFYDWLVGRSM